MDIARIVEEYGFSETESKFIKDSNTATTADANQALIVSNLIVSKSVNQAAHSIILSNTNLTDATKNNSNWMVYLTGALVFVGIIQILLPFIKPLLSSK